MPTREGILHALEQVYDPEIPVDIVNLLRSTGIVLIGTSHPQVRQPGIGRCGTSPPRPTGTP